MSVKPAIYFLCPDMDIPSGGINRIYRLAQISSEWGFSACVLHQKKGFRNQWAPYDPNFQYWGNGFIFSPGDVVVIPESEPTAMQQLPNNLRKIVLALDWSYIFENLPMGQRWTDYGICQVLTASRVVQDFIAWTMHLPVYRITPPIDHERFYFDPLKKKNTIAYMAHRNDHGEWIEKIFRQLPRQLSDWNWIPIKGMTVEAYAEVMRRARIFVSTGLREGVPGPILEAMASGTIVVGYSGVGGNEYLVSEGPEQNAFRVENEDYFALCRKLESVIKKVERVDPSIDTVRRNASKTVKPLTFVAEKESLFEFWEQFLTPPPGSVINETKQSADRSHHVRN
jgi:hypothetical protein